MARYLLSDMEGIVKGLRSIAQNAATLHSSDLSTRLQNCTFVHRSSDALPSLLRQTQKVRPTNASDMMSRTRTVLRGLRLQSQSLFGPLRSHSYDSAYSTSALGATQSIRQASTGVQSPTTNVVTKTEKEMKEAQANPTTPSSTASSGASATAQKASNGDTKNEKQKTEKQISKDKEKEQTPHSRELRDVEKKSEVEMPEDVESKDLSEAEAAAKKIEEFLNGPKSPEDPASKDKIVVTPEMTKHEEPSSESQKVQENMDRILNTKTTYKTGIPTGKKDV